MVHEVWIAPAASGKQTGAAGTLWHVLPMPQLLSPVRIHRLQLPSLLCKERVKSPC